VQKETVFEVDVIRVGEKLILPEGLDLNDAIGVLQRKAKEEEQEVNVSHDFNMTPPEGAIAFLRTLTEMFGFVSPKESPGFFGPKPPEYVSFETSPGVTESVPWGRLSIPGINGYLTTAINWIDGAPRFRIAGVVRGKHKATVQKIADNMRKRTDSLYRGKAIIAAFPKLGEETAIDDYFPKFMPLPNINADDLIFSDEIQDLIATAVFTPIEHSQVCRDNGISLKRGILLEGPYGTGKTLTATVTARKCVENGWTFLYLKNVKDLPRAIDFAKQYTPITIFAEDIDQVLSDPDHRDEEVNAVLNSIDGIDSKNLEILTVLTTNNVDKITTAMLRPGRLDTVVPVRAPDAKAAVRLVKLFAGSQIAADQDFTAVGERLAGCIPAMIQEVVKRSKLGAVRRAASGGVLEITAHDVEVAAVSMLAHMELLKPKEPDNRSDRVLAAEALGDRLGRALSDVVTGSSKLPNGKSSGVHSSTPISS
jgi:transitional endoplasmic reticulum ATPase